MKDTSPEVHLSEFLAKYTPEIAALAKAALAKMRARLPGAVQLVYDNYNALVVGFGPSERASEAIFSMAVYPRWVNLFFLRGADLADPQKVLKGSGKVVRHVVIKDAAVLDSPAIHELMKVALGDAARHLESTGEGRMVIKSISPKQRPRRPA